MFYLCKPIASLAIPNSWFKLCIQTNSKPSQDYIKTSLKYFSVSQFICQSVSILDEIIILLWLILINYDYQKTCQNVKIASRRSTRWVNTKSFWKFKNFGTYLLQSSVKKDSKNKVRNLWFFSSLALRLWFKLKE